MAEKQPPEFVTLMDSDPDRAFREFYKFLKKLISLNPPTPLRLLSKEDQEEVINNVATKCYLDNWKVMKKCTKSGGSLSGYLYVMVHNAAIDRLRDKWQRITTLYEDWVEDSSIAVGAFRDPGPNPERKAISANILDIVRKTILRMSEHCQMLLLLASEECVPREIVEVLILPKDQNKGTSDDLRECRKTLKRLLVQNGIEIDAILEEIKYS